MKAVYLTDAPLSAKAQELVQFDIDSIRQAAAGRRAAAPTLYAADPARYEKNGRILRDSDAPRVLGYSPTDNLLYANDGCNSCTHTAEAPVGGMTAAQLEAFAAANNVPLELLLKLAASL